jgi:two-component system chemotaxis response regulator CheB
MIVIGASAGGIEALQEILSSFPHDFGASILIVIHTAPRDGHLAEVLARSAHMVATDAEHGKHIKRSQIYVAPPDQHLIVDDTRVVLSRGPKVNRHRPAIDPLFESAAKVFRKGLVGVVLSGYLDDGTAGLAAIKAGGGISVVQDPKDAVAPNMPKSALRNVSVDYCLPASEIAPLLIQLIDGKKVKKNHRK